MRSEINVQKPKTIICMPTIEQNNQSNIPNHYSLKFRIYFRKNCVSTFVSERWFN